MTAAVWGPPHTGPVDQWSRSTWSDARGAAGIPGIEALYHRWRSTGFNYNRGRANTICAASCATTSCTPTSTSTPRWIPSDPDVVANAVIANPSCAGCHQTSILSRAACSRSAASSTSASCRTAARRILSAVPGWPGDPPADHEQSAPRCSSGHRGQARRPRPGDRGGSAVRACTATWFASYLTEVRKDQLSGAWIARLQAAFVAGTSAPKQLAKQIVLSDEFRVSYDTDDAQAAALVGAQKVRPDQLSRML
ncbi:MAG: hypothetical protein IPQ07_23565 [Myxococcales bacterium]|nr:hypothetical protein [Myxococcales bacterium]